MTLPTRGPVLVRAAGVLPFRHTSQGLEVALVHRPRYADWSWAKGKLDRGEDFATAAARECLEETGLQVRLGVPLLLTANVIGTEGRRTTARGTVVAADEPGTVLAEAEGLFVALRPETAAATFAGVDHAVQAWTAR